MHTLLSLHTVAIASFCPWYILVFWKDSPGFLLRNHPPLTLGQILVELAPFPARTRDQHPAPLHSSGQCVGGVYQQQDSHWSYWERDGFFPGITKLMCSRPGLDGGQFYALLGKACLKWRQCRGHQGRQNGRDTEPWGSHVCTWIKLRELTWLFSYVDQCFKKF